MLSTFSQLCQPVDEAKLSWTDSGIPYSEDYNDIYFSQTGGREESCYVFLQHNQLQERWQSMAGNYADDPTSPSSFIIGETGFGTGLNFLNTSTLWLECSHTDMQLHYIAVDKHPFSKKNLALVLKPFSKDFPLIEELLQQYPPITPGMHRINLYNNRVHLTLIFADAVTAFRHLYNTTHFSVDAWFLDGFNPASNPDMWSSDLFTTLSGLSHPQTTFSTFTAAGYVRRNLEDSGFQVEKAPGFAQKREMLYGKLSDKKPIPGKLPFREIWHKLPKQSYTRQAVIVGAGLAGCCTAYSLATRGWKVNLIEQHEQIAQEASGNPIGILQNKIFQKPTADCYFYTKAFVYTLQLLNALNRKNLWNSCGLIHLASNQRQSKRQENLIAKNANYQNLLKTITNKDVNDISGINLNESGLYFPEACWIQPEKLCHALIDHPNIRLTTGKMASEIYHTHEHSWQLVDAQQNLITEAPVVILTSANNTTHFPQTHYLPLRRVRGQITLLKPSKLSNNMKTIICEQGYCSPAVNGVHTVGASFNPDDISCKLSTEDHRSNLNLLEQFAQGVFPQPGTDLSLLDGRVAFRCITEDYLPIVSQAPDYEKFQETFAQLKRNARANISPQGPYHKGLYLNIGHGSHGLTTIPLSSEILAATLCGEPPPVPAVVLDILSAARFIIRDLKRQRL